MKKPFCLILFLLLAIAVEGSSGARTGGGNRPAPSAVKETIESEDGDIVDCVDIYKQPAFDHPKLKNHIIQMRSTQHANIRGSSTTAVGSPIMQAWKRSGSCPQGTIPIIRTQNISQQQPRRTALLQTNAGDGVQNVANAMVFDIGGPFIGVSGTVQVWGAYAEPDEYTMNTVLCTSRKNGQPILDLVGVGTIVYPALFGDNNTRLMIGWTKDNTNSPICVNLACPGFVQTNNEVALGSVFPNVSLYGVPDRQFMFDAAIYLDQNQRRWWVAIQNQDVGYFPMEIFSDFGECDVAMWGGTASNSKSVPTLTQMGNGHFSGEGLTRTGAIYNARVRKQDAGIVTQHPSGYIINHPQCYDMKNQGPGAYNLPGYSYLYGGPGAGSPSCM